MLTLKNKFFNKNDDWQHFLDKKPIFSPVVPSKEGIQAFFLPKKNYAQSITAIPTRGNLDPRLREDDSAGLTCIKEVSTL